MITIVYEVFLEYLRLHYANENTRRQYQDCCLRFIRNIGLDLSQESADKFLGTFTNNSLNRGFIKALSDCFKANIMVPKQRSRKGLKIYKFLNKADIDSIINGTSPKTSLMVRIYFETGLRLSELINAHRDNFNLTDNYIEGIGKGKKPFKELFSKNTANLISDYFKSFKEVPDYPFRYGSLKHSAKKFQYDLKKECAAIGIKGMHPHKIRHSLGHYLRESKGWDIEEIKVKLRHSDIRTTSIYATATKDEIDNKMRGIFNE